jgi:hypothetical protein
VTKMPKRSGVDRKPTPAELERQLDDALRQTFPASDPVTIGEPTGLVPDRPADRQAPLLDIELVNELAAHLERSISEKTARGANASSAPHTPRRKI